MPVSNALAGLEMLQKAFESKSTKRHDLEKLFKEHGYKLDVDKAKQELEAARELLKDQRTLERQREGDARAMERTEVSSLATRSNAALNLRKQGRAESGAALTDIVPNMDPNRVSMALFAKALEDGSPASKQLATDYSNMVDYANQRKSYNQAIGQQMVPKDKSGYQKGMFNTEPIEKALPLVFESMGLDFDLSKPLLPQEIQAAKDKVKMTVIGKNGQPEQTEFSQAKFVTEFNNRIAPYIRNTNDLISKDPSQILGMGVNILTRIETGGVGGLKENVSRVMENGEPKWVKDKPSELIFYVPNSALIEATQKNAAPTAPNFLQPTPPLAPPPSNAFQKQPSVVPQAGAVEDDMDSYISGESSITNVGNPNDQYAPLEPTPGE